MEKSWISMNRLLPEYESGVEAFLNFALENARDARLIPCPCTVCGNIRKKNIETIRLHMMCNGIDPTYKKWIWHGENMYTPSTRDSDRIDSTDANYSVDEPINMIHDAYDAYEDNPIHFQMLLEDAQKPLYNDCTKFTKLSAVVKLYNLKARYSWSDSSLSDLFSLLAEMLPEGNEVPLSLYDAKKSLSTLGLHYEKISACPNDCILYRLQYKDFDVCPTCGSSKWKVGRDGKHMKGVPSKVLWYFPPIPRFRNLKGVKFLFVNPFGISYGKNITVDDRARNLAEMLCQATPDQVVLVPCNVGEHWILTIIHPHKELVYLMDPIAHRNRDATWKSVVDTAFKTFHAHNEKKNFKKLPKWEIIKFPSSYSYSKDEIDEVRDEWATCLIEHLRGSGT